MAKKRRWTVKQEEPNRYTLNSGGVAIDFDEFFETVDDYYLMNGGIGVAIISKKENVVPKTRKKITKQRRQKRRRPITERLFKL